MPLLVDRFYQRTAGSKRDSQDGFGLRLGGSSVGLLEPHCGHPMRGNLEVRPLEARRRLDRPLLSSGRWAERSTRRVVGVLDLMVSDGRHNNQPVRGLGGQNRGRIGSCGRGFPCRSGVWGWAGPASTRSGRLLVVRLQGGRQQ